MIDCTLLYYNIAYYTIILHKELQSEYHELDGHSHFFEPWREILEAIRCRADNDSNDLTNSSLWVSDWL